MAQRLLGLMSVFGAVVLQPDMSDTAARHRQELGQLYRALARTVRTLQRTPPLIPGTLYLLQRKCGKPNCRCARGALHPRWVLTRSEAGQARLYSVPAAHRAWLRARTREYRLWQLARARLTKQSTALLGLADQLAADRLEVWPPPPPP